MSMGTLYSNRPASLMKLLQKINCLVSVICSRPVQHNQKCIMVNMSADPVAMIDGLVHFEHT